MLREYKPSDHGQYITPMSTVQVHEDTSADKFEEGDCKAMHKWQIEYKPACNNIHAINPLENMFLAEGEYRSAWWMMDGDGSDAVIKTLVWARELEQRELHRHMRDANIMSVLQSSPHIPNIYGYCEYCTEYTIHV